MVLSNEISILIQWEGGHEEGIGRTFPGDVVIRIAKPHYMKIFNLPDSFILPVCYIIPVWWHCTMTNHRSSYRWCNLYVLSSLLCITSSFRRAFNEVFNDVQRCFCSMCFFLWICIYIRELRFVSTFGNAISIALYRNKEFRYALYLIFIEHFVFL